MLLRALLMVVLLAVAACSGSGWSPPRVIDANGQTGGQVTVRRGDTAWSIARATGVTLADLIHANGLAPPYRLLPGQRLFIPNLRLHRVRKGESISVIAEYYDVGRRALTRLNNIKPPYRIFPRQILKIPGSEGDSVTTTIARRASSPAIAAAPPAPPKRGAAKPTRRTAKKKPPAPKAKRAAPVKRPPKISRASASRLAWPLRGRVVSRFGPKQGGLHNDGVNIAAPAGSPVTAASDGAVVYAGNEIKGFGNLVLIRHSGGLTTAYAHLDRIMVKPGQKVAQGATIATVGATGGVDRPQLHFEIRKGRRALDPVRALGALPTAS